MTSSKYILVFFGKETMEKVIAENRKARHDYFLEDFYEAGIALTGTEIKSVRKGAVQFKDAYIDFVNNEAFIRDIVPMTKEEVREISLCKLHLTEDSILYDIGSGTGSVTVEAAGLSDSVFVYAIERKEEAGVLTEQNRSRFHLDNVEIIRGKAPEALAGLKPATHAFIGGSGGNLKEIIDSLYRINPNMRVVMNAVSIETIGEIKEILKLPYVANPDVVLAQFSHGRNVTDYTLMSADNPVWICAFDFKPESE